MKKMDIIRALNLIDLFGQSFILGWMMLAQVFGLITFQLDLITAGLVWAGMFLGPWQMTSSVITTLGKARFLKWRVCHLLFATLYLAGFSAASNFSPPLTAPFEKGFVIFIGILIPAALAALYYVITLKTFMTLGTYARLKYFFAK